MIEIITVNDLSEFKSEFLMVHIQIEWFNTEKKVDRIRKCEKMAKTSINFSVFTKNKIINYWIWISMKTRINSLLHSKVNKFQKKNAHFSASANGIYFKW